MARQKEPVDHSNSNYGTWMKSVTSRDVINSPTFVLNVAMHAIDIAIDQATQHISEYLALRLDCQEVY